MCVFVPSQVNILLLLGCIAMVAGFQDTTALGHAYGQCVRI
jgi:K+ transporter